ncbi:sulfate permease [Stipitochalara longipes BDJ]|nr:sulfate permease [Stipitochalara longipes BDJ]
MKLITKLRGEIETDENLHRARSQTLKGARACPSASTEYLLDKLPVIRWLPNYCYKWILRDVVAGITVGALLVPQALAYAKIARIPLSSGLLASWLGPALYAVMGTSKDVGPGPTTIMGLLTGAMVRDLAPSGFKPQDIGAAVTFIVGIYALIVGFLKLGFILDFVSLPVLNGFFSAACFNIILSQVPSLFGEKIDRSTTGSIIHDIFHKLPQTQPLTFAVGISSIACLVLLQYAGSRFGRQYQIIWFISLCRNAIVLILFTGVSYAINKHHNSPKFAIAEVSSIRISNPSVPSTTLMGKVSRASITIFLAVSVEHLAMAKAFSQRNGYIIDESQELCFLGLSNFINGFFPTMPGGGGISRTAVNSESGVKSPLGGLATTAFVIISIYQLTGALYWIPKATLAAILVTAVWQIITPVKAFYGYWRTSLADFVASMICFWLTLFISVEMGIAAGVGFSALHLLFRTMFASLTQVTGANMPILYPDENLSLEQLPAGIKVFKFPTSIVFANAYRIKNTLMNMIQVCNAGSQMTENLPAEDRCWSDDGGRRIEKMRARAGITSSPNRIQVVVLDFACVAFIDVTGLQALKGAKRDLMAFAGHGFELRFVGLNENVRLTFKRSGWTLVDIMDAVEEIFASMQSAVFARRVEREVVSVEVKGE